jgi:hypothetical protein
VLTKDERGLDRVDLPRFISRAITHRLQRLPVGRRVDAENRARDEGHIVTLLRDETAHKSFVRRAGQAERGPHSIPIGGDVHRTKNTADVEVDVCGSNPTNRA